ncbi:MAG: site-2 protease family protein [Thermodesulfovibrionales bacterium]
MRKIPYLHIVLFALTFCFTLMAGASFKGIDVYQHPAQIWEGLDFSLTLMTILLAHELAHYLAAKKHHIVATLPYFIPVPPIIPTIGTLGAFIKMKSPIRTRRALIDVGAAGPIAGFLLSIAVTVIGLSYSSIVPVQGAKGALGLGDSLLFSFLIRLVKGVPPESHEVLLHPMAFAGWLGFFVTSLNLIPIGQLDGGHIAYAFLGTRHRSLSRILVAVLLIMGLVAILQVVANEAGASLPNGISQLVNRFPDLWAGWAFWGAIMLILGIKHPPVIHWETPLDVRRRFVGVIALIIFIITFMPAPFKIF